MSALEDTFVIAILLMYSTTDPARIGNSATQCDSTGHSVTYDTLICST